MKVLTLVLALLALVCSDDTVLDDPSQLDVENVLQSQIFQDGIIKYSNGILTFTNDEDKGYFKVTHGAGNNKNDYSIKAVKSVSNPIALNSDDPNAPQVYPQHNYNTVIGVGKGLNRKYMLLEPDPSQQYGFKFANQVITSYSVEKSQTYANAKEPSDEDNTNLIYTTVVVPGNEIPVGIVSMGTPEHRVHFKIVRSSNKRGDVQVEAINDPDHLDTPPDPNNEHAPKVVKKGDPSSIRNAPIIATGPRFNRRYNKLLVYKNKVKCIPVKRQRIAGTNKFKYIQKKRHRRHRKNIHKVNRHRLGHLLKRPSKTRASLRRINQLGIYKKHHARRQFGKRLRKVVSRRLNSHHFKKIKPRRKFPGNIIG